ncbi:hypothetical protein P4T04_06375 [Bacillus badius]|uniref:hypothetical protein n=1 Tax=Bacillus badius TaxID=1455 RepID=UPI002E23396E|nr:hypothetical protein [Bacillus badius]
MTITETEQPVYDERVKEILRELAAGRTREELAEEAGNTNWKSIDMYMRRRNFTWDSRKQTYIPRKNPFEQDFTTDSSKAGRVRSLISKEGADAKTVAELLGFRDHRELAEYMYTKGYVWDRNVKNYVKNIGEVLSDTKVETEKEAQSPKNDSVPKRFIDGETLERFIPLLEILDKHQERLLGLISPTTQAGTIPRFIVPGIGKTKTVQMMNTLEQLVVDFSREKNISQRELFEVALIEFFRKYGYEHEVNRLLSR